MTRMIALWRSALGKKAVMAVTGVILFGFVLSHMAGNLKVFQGEEKFDAYAHWLREIGYPAVPHSGVLWTLRIALLAALALHVVATVQLTLINRRARPERYRKLAPVQLDYASRTMRWSGVLVLAYVVYHLMHLTWGNAHPEFVSGAPYHNLVTGLAQWPIALAYIVANLLLGLHLYHGLWSLFQSLGWNHSLYRRIRRPFAVTFAVVVTAGFLAVPIAILLGVVE